jgi:hypothetical protein
MAPKPLKTLSALEAPPQVSRLKCAGQEACGQTKSSPGDKITQPLASCGTRANACKVSMTMGCPATSWYCLGMGVPARLPVPAQGIKAWNCFMSGDSRVGAPNADQTHQHKKHRAAQGKHTAPSDQVHLRLLLISGWVAIFCTFDEFLVDFYVTKNHNLPHEDAFLKTKTGSKYFSRI